MVHYIALFRVGKGATDEDLEEMIRASRTCFHRVNEAHNFRSGRSIDAKSEFAFFLSADFESRDKLAMFREDPHFLRFENEVLKHHTTSRVEHLFETEPGKDPKYS
jgi:Stress responsive A/B Barrel Domain